MTWNGRPRLVVLAIATLLGCAAGPERGNAGRLDKRGGCLLATLRTDLEGNNHTLYSLRHTYATLRIEEGAPHYLIAQNMGTSIEMLEKHYVKLAMVSVGHEITRMRTRK